MARSRTPPVRPVCVFVGLATAVLGATWVETDWDEFRDGTFEHNLYVSHRDSGTVEFVPRFDLNNDAWIDLVCSDWTGPYLRVYFGDSSGFSAARRRIFPITYGGGSDAADLNCDGYADLIRPGWHSDPCIYWGSDSGHSPDNQTILSAHGAEATMTADLDNDGYLDIVFPGEDGPLVIYWGTASGYTSSQRTEIPIGYGMGFNSEIADLNRDGYLDIIVTCYNPSGEQPVIYFGAGRAYHIEWLQYRASSEYGPHGLTVADFDHNGWLDVVYTGFADITESYIYFGSAQGFSTSRRTIVAPGHCHGGSAAYDFDRDGWVDLLFFRGNGNYGDYSRPVIYYNCGTAPYFDDSRTQLVGNIPLRLSGGLIGDFNRDGNTDIYVACFESNTPSPMPSLVLWGPDWMTADTLECEVDHHSHPREPGNTYDRTYREDYLSSVFDADAVTHWQSVTWDDSSPGGSSVELSVRTGNTPSPDSTWSGWVDVTNGGPVPDSLDSRHIQYQATLKYQNPASLPMLFEVRVAYGSGLTHDVGATSIVAPAGTVDSGTVRVPRAVVRNFGTTGAVFPVTMRIGVGYSQSVSETLAAGIADTVSFPVWTATPTGVLPVTCFTGLTGDENPANDTIRDSVRVVGPPEHDVGATAILSPTGTVHTGDTVIPMARAMGGGIR
ncbi:MAG: VCBS repeat-containing protein [candidate division WOR-3 bacterium]|nr:VCBS repeat-containing protein [candidate division WOR-3 bacterium]